MYVKCDIMWKCGFALFWNLLTFHWWSSGQPEISDPSQDLNCADLYWISGSKGRKSDVEVERMDALPQAPRPSLKPKVVALYEQLFRVWLLLTLYWLYVKDFVAEEDDYFAFNEMFVLQPRPAELATILSPLDGNDFMSIHTTTQAFFKEGVKNLKSTDESKINNVLVVCWLNSNSNLTE